MDFYKIFFGILFVFIVGTLLHFTYEWSGNNSIVGYFSPVNESVWEHMKMLFFPMLVYGLFTLGTTNDSCKSSAFSASILIGTFLIPIIFYTYTNLLGRNFLILDILTFLISIIIAFICYYFFTIHCTFGKYDRPLSFGVFLLLIAFIIFTHLPPKRFPIFQEP
ncbi:DUF6512 family protein [Clostridium sp. E02]|uniref:DUF6512 family protein n=1 Tax=Clostridium sp. E02 TaxID=2487134 RepID=UPI000F53F300|nr:DUF6512 family protein [Clostridium sp. E02]